jgi:MFS family permease
VARVDERPSVWQVLTNRQRYGVFFVGAVLSNIGTWCQTLAAVLLVFRLTDSTLVVGLASVCQFVWPLLLGPWAGVVADRFDRRAVLTVVQLGAAVVSGTLGVLTVTGQVRLGHALVAIGLLGVAQAFQAPAQLALVPSLVTPEDRDIGLSLNSTQFNIARAVGPVVASGLIVLGGLGLPFLVNAASFVAFVVLVRLARPAAQLRPARRPRLRETVAAVRSHPALLPLFALGFVISGSTDAVTTLGPAISVRLTGTDGQTGWLVTAFGIGATVSAVWLVPRVRRFRRRLPWTIGLQGLGVLVLGLAPVPAVAYLGALLWGSGFLLSSNRCLTTVQTLVPPETLGRVTAVWLMAFLGGRAVYAPLTGALADAAGPRVALVAVACTVAVAAVGAVRLSRRAA